MNGYENYETWVCALWIQNTYDECKYWESRAETLIKEYGTFEAKYLLADEIKTMIESSAPDLKACIYSDLLEHGICEINYKEVAEVFIED